MHLIHEIQATGEIQNMSTQAENAVNCDIVEIKLELNNANKENNPNIDDEANSVTAKCLKIGTETIKQSVLEEEIHQDSNINGNNNCNSEVIDILNDVKVMDEVNSVIEKTTNGVSDSCNENELICNNLPSEMSTTEKGFEKELNLSNSKQNCDDTEIKSKAVVDIEQIEFSNNALSLSDDTKDNDVVPEENAQNSNTETSMIVTEAESSSEKQEDVCTPNVESIISKEICETLRDNKLEPMESEDTIITNKDTDDDTIVESTSSSPKYEQNEALISDNDIDKKILNNGDNIFKHDKNISSSDVISTDILVSKEINSTSGVLAEIAISDEKEISTEETLLEKETSTLNEDIVAKGILISEKKNCTLKVPADIVLNDEINTSTETNLLVYENLVSNDVNNSANDSIDEEMNFSSKEPIDIATNVGKNDSFEEDILENEKYPSYDVNLPEKKLNDEEMNCTSEVPADIAMNDERKTLSEIIYLPEKKINDEEINCTSEVSADIAMNDERNTLSEKNELLSNDVKNYKDVSNDEQMNKSTDIAMNDEKNTSIEETVLGNERLPSNDVSPSGNILIDEDINSLPVEQSENQRIVKNTTSDVLFSEDVLMEDEIVKPTEVSLQVASDTSSYIVTNNESDTTNHIIIKPDVLAPVDNSLLDVVMDEADKIISASEIEIPPLTSIEEPTNHAKGQVEPLAEKTFLFSVDETSKAHECLSTDKVEFLSQLNGVKRIPSPVMDDSHDVTIAEPISISTISDNTPDRIEQENNTGVDNCLNAVKKSKESVVSDVYDEKELVTVQEGPNVVPMEVDDVGIIDLNKEKCDKDINNSESSVNDDIIDINNDTEIMELELKTKLLQDKSTENSTLNEEVVNKADKIVGTVKVSEVPIRNETKELDDRDKVEIIDEDEITIVEKSEKEASTEPEEKSNSAAQSKTLPVVIDEDEITIVEKSTDKAPTSSDEKEESQGHVETKTLPVVCKLSNTLDILSDDEEESTKLKTNEADNSSAEKQCIDIDDDDDIMLIEDDSNSKEASSEVRAEILNKKEVAQPEPSNEINLDILDIREKEVTPMDSTQLSPKINEKDSSPVTALNTESASVPHTEKALEEKSVTTEQPLLPQNFLKTAKKNLADMTRDELEEFCILRIIEGIVDRSNLSDIKTKIKIMAQNLEDYRKRAMMLTKQNRDLQVVLKSVQEEQRKRTNAPIQPLKITRSVGMQVLMNDRLDPRRKAPIQVPSAVAPVSRPQRVPQNVTTKNIKPVGTPALIPVPRKVPVSNSPAKSLTNSPLSNIGKIASPNGLRNPSPVQKAPEKRTHSRMQSTSSSVTVDLTDDEPPAKINNVPPVRLVPPQNLLNQQRPFAPPLNSPRKVFIPISGPQAQNIRPGQTLMMKGGPVLGPRQRMPSLPRIQQSPIRVQKQVNQRHPAPLPDAMKQYTPPTWKALPPAPDLKLSKVENGIVISWKIDGYPDGDYETIASYQLYAYQETNSPPCTALWKKIGDVKALPLPMACTLTQFMAGFKYYFAVRAVDIRSRLGPFSLPGSILLLNKM